MYFCLSLCKEAQEFKKTPCYPIRWCITNKLMSTTLSFVPDRDIACELAEEYPIPFDHLIEYEDASHKYAIVQVDVRGDKLYIEEHVIGTTTLIGMFSHEFDSYGGPNFGVRKKIKRIYNAWLESGKPLPSTAKNDWWKDYQEYIPLDIWAKMHGVLHMKTDFVDSFREYFQYKALFRVLREETPGHDKFRDDIIEKFDRWEKETDRDPDKYMEYLGKDAMKCFCFPPHVYPTDVVNFWSGLTVAGTILHRRIELFYNRHELPPCDTDVWKMFIDFNETHRPHIIRTEINVAIPELLMCGQMDAVGLAPDEDSLIDYDWKRTKKLKSIPELDTDYASALKENRYMKGPWSHLLDTARNHYMIQQNVYMWAWKVMMGMTANHIHRQWKRVKGGTVDLTKLSFSAAYLVVLSPTNDGYYLISVPVFQEGDQNHTAMMQMFAIRAAQIRELLKANMQVDASQQDGYLIEGLQKQEEFIEKLLS